MKKLLIREINEISVPKLFWNFGMPYSIHGKLKLLNFKSKNNITYLYFHNHTIKEKSYNNLTSEYNNYMK